jgi:hypothetical protein
MNENTFSAFTEDWTLVITTKGWTLPITTKVIYFNT